MILINSILLFLLLFVCIGEEPQKICHPTTPFKRNDQSCGSFYEICAKKNDDDCDNFKKACEQCPLSNFSFLTYENVLYIRSEMKRSNLNLNVKKNIISNTASQSDCSNNTVVITIFCLILILGHFIFDVFVFWKKFKFIGNRRKDKGNDEEQNLISSQPNDETIQEIKNKIKHLQSITNKSKETIQNMINKKEYSAFDSVASYKMRFQIANQFDETELFVSKFDSVIKLKKSICDGNMNDYKRMIMKYKDVTLDNNQYLLSCIDSTNIYPIFCEFDDNIDVDAMIVIKLKCDNIYHEMLQIWKYQTIKHLKIIISKLNKTNHEDLLIFYKSNQLDDDDDKSIDYYKIEDNNSIFVVNKSEEMLNISMKSIFNDKETISIEISIFDKVESIINKSIDKIQHKMATNHFAVFLNKKLLENEKFIYEYNIDSKSLIEFCYLKNMNEIVDILPVRDYCNIRLIKARNKSFDCPVLLRGHHKGYIEYMGDEYFWFIMKEQAKMFQITKYHPRFLQLFGIYKDNDYIYVEMDNSTKSLMRTFLLNNNEISTYEESKWAYEMLEGLKHLHSNNIILKDMNPMNIWIDVNNHDLKLPSFNVTDYLNHLDDKKYKYKNGILTYVAPEILKGKPYDASVDVWSLGVVMIEIMQGGHIFPGLKESDVVKEIKESRTIEYDKTNKPADLINFIDCCLKYDPKQRSTIDQLMKHEFIQKYLSSINFV